MLPIQSFRKKTNSAQETEILLDQLPSPAIIWNGSNGSVTANNAQFILMSGYSHKEIKSLAFEQLFPEIDKLPITPVISSTIVHLARGIKTRSDISIVPLDPSIQQYLILIKGASPQEGLPQPSEERWQAIRELLTAATEPNLEKAILSTLAAGSALTGATHLGVYLPIPGSKTKLILLQSIGNSDLLPKIIDVDDIKHLHIPVIWQLGTRTSSVLHQKALAAQFSYLATNPLDSNLPDNGLVVIADPFSKAPRDLLIMLGVLAQALKNTFYLHSTIDSTKKKLNASNVQLEIIQEIKDQITDGIILVDQDRNIVDINNSACLTLGFFELEILRQPLEKILVCDCGLTEILDSIQDDLSAVHEIGEVSVQQRSGKTIPVHLRAIPLSLDVNAPAIALLLSDLSTIKAIETRSKQLEMHASIGEMIAVFAHEVRNPINNIRMGIENFAVLLDEPEEIEEEVDRLLGDVDRISELMKSILSAYRTKEYKIEPINLEGLIQNILYRWQPRMDRYGIDFKLVCSETNSQVKGDRKSIEQVFTNIIQNSINAMQDTGGLLSVKISDDKSTRMVQVDIADTGPGIPQEIKDKIFNLYFSTRQNGNGIGLAITKQIIDAHNGQIKVNSVPGGTVFTISLPADSQ